MPALGWLSPLGIGGTGWGGDGGDDSGVFLSHRTERSIGAGLFLPVVLASPRAEDLFHVTSLPHPTSRHSGPSAWSPAGPTPRQEETPGASLIEAFSVPLKPKEFFLLYLPCLALPPPLPHYVMFLGGPPGPAKALSPP